jgi:hypothetical protein
VRFAENLASSRTTTAEIVLPNDILRPSTNAEIIHQINPVNYARRIHQEFCRTGNVVSLHSCSGVQEIVSANDGGVGVGKNGIRVSLPFAQIPGDLRPVDTPGDSLARACAPQLL